MPMRLRQRNPQAAAVALLSRHLHLLWQRSQQRSRHPPKARVDAAARGQLSRSLPQRPSQSSRLLHVAASASGRPLHQKLWRSQRLQAAPCGAGLLPALLPGRRCQHGAAGGRLRHPSLKLRLREEHDLGAEEVR